MCHRLMYLHVLQNCRIMERLAFVRDRDGCGITQAGTGENAFFRFLRCFCFLSFSCDEKPKTRMPLFPIHIHDSTYNTCSRASVPCPNERNALHFIAHETNKGIAEGKPKEKREKKKIKDTVSMWM